MSIQYRVENFRAFCNKARFREVHINSFDNKINIRKFKKTTTATATGTGTSLNKRINEQNNGCARVL